MNINPVFIQKVQSFLDEKGLTTVSDIVNALNARDIVNPNKQENIPIPFDFAVLAGAMSASSLGKIATYQHLPQIVSDVRNRDREAIGFWATALAAADIITIEEVNLIIQTISSVIPDPNWQEKLSWAELNLGGFVTEDDIKQCKLI